jgi:two-component system response regulator FlrC
VRELENVLQRATILAPGSVIEPEHLALPDGTPPAVPAASRPEQGGESGRVAAADLAASSGAGQPRPTDLKSLEKTHILETLASVGGVRKLAAERLGMSERTLRYKLAQYRLEDADGGKG